MGRLVSLDECREIVKHRAALGETLVFTNGVFDLLHLGHVRYLQEARSLGDALIVGLNGDGSARLLKGPGRPLTPELERAEILCALECVDYVVIFDEPTAEHVLEALQPDLYVKGGDYRQACSSTQDMLPEARVVEGYGGQVRILPFAEDHSTAGIIRRIHTTVPRERQES
jgi:rfaE bifunctional protein nucleotidyltransferase chain/domain